MRLDNLLTEAIQPPPKGKKFMLLLDIDDTLVTATGIFIYKKLPNGKEQALTPAEFAKEKVTPENKKNYDLRDFDDPEKVKQSIIKGRPIIRNLKLMDRHHAAGWKIGILTARGMEDTVYDALSSWLMVFDFGAKKLKPAVDILNRNFVAAISDKKYEQIYKGMTHFDRKVAKIKELLKKFDYIKFLDDDLKNINAVKEKIKSGELPKDRVVAVLAAKE
jgi:hypothetical protein